jgi:hypothetical protein
MLGNAKAHGENYQGIPLPSICGSSGRHAVGAIAKEFNFYLFQMTNGQSLTAKHLADHAHGKENFVPVVFVKGPTADNSASRWSVSR